MRIRIFKQSQLKLQLKHPFNCPVYHPHGKFPRVHSLLHPISKSFGSWVFHIKSCLNRQLSGLLKAVSYTERIHQSVNCHIVRYHNSLKAHLIPQKFSQECFGRHHGFPVHRAVRAHHASHAGLRDRTLERLAVNFFYIPWRHHIPSHIDTALSNPMPHKVFRRCSDSFSKVLRLKASHKCARHSRCQSRILPICLGHPAPSGIPCNVHHRGKRLAEPHLQHLPADHLRHPPNQLRLKRGCLRNRARENIRLCKLCPCTRLTVNQRRDTKLCLLHKKLLQTEYIFRNILHTRCRGKRTHMPDS